MTTRFARRTVETGAVAPRSQGLPTGRRRRALFNARLAGCALGHIAMAVVALAAWSGSSHAQTATAATQTLSTPQEHTAPVVGSTAATEGLSDLDAMTFSCPRAGLNAAAREAAKIPSQGTYQFAYFRIINDAHHAAYEIHFKSNYEGETDLKYCVSLYCQQGWDPKTTKASVALIGGERQRLGAAAHGTACGAAPALGKRRSTR